MNPCVSVVIATYNRRDLVQEAIHSVLRQTFKDFELIVVIDGTDDTPQALAPMAEQGLLKIINDKHRGLVGARNRGIAEARGKYLAIFDDDDLWPEDKLQWQVELMEAHPDWAMVYGYSDIFETGKESMERDPLTPGLLAYETMLQKCRVRSPGQTLMRTEQIRQIGGFDDQCPGTDDWDLYLRLYQFGKIHAEPRTGLKYRFHPFNTSSHVRLMYNGGTFIRHRHIGRFPSLQNFRIWRAQKKQCRGYVFFIGTHAARRLIAAGQFEKARKIVLELLSVDPTWIRFAEIRKLLVSAWRQKSLATGKQQ